VTIRPRAAAGKARRQLAVDLIDDLVTLDRKIKDINGRRPGLLLCVESGQLSANVPQVHRVGAVVGQGG